MLDGVTLHVEKGQTVCLLGPSGGGKSTLLRCVNGLNEFDTGTITVGNHQLHPQSTAQLEQVRRAGG
ncbi:MAG TPA: ATP-binding cassette domain-containing protein, partial [Gemmatales bacterium]|nr:ATP-binding cassette domain-containing protein [Gemmatales bacterium]